jgi:predicted TIM-barrel fold metal-dependent hydrolase
MLNDSHCHFFSSRFFTALSRQRGHEETAGALCQALQWDDPGTPEDLADRWVKELDAHGVTRTALIASVPGDEASVAAAVARHPGRFVGFFMVDPSAEHAADRATHAIAGLGLRVACLFPAMHHVPLADARIERIVDAVATQPGTAVFVHCGVLSVGVRKKLGLPSRFDLSLGDPLSLTRLAQTFPRLPFIVPHFGAGMLRETMMAADASWNIHVDTSSSNSWIRYAPGWTLQGVFKTAMSVVGPSRLLFGTDSSFFPRGWQRAIYESQKAAASEAGISERDQALIFGDNFDRLFPLAVDSAAAVASGPP